MIRFPYAFYYCYLCDTNFYGMHKTLNESLFCRIVGLPSSSKSNFQEKTTYN